MTTHQEPILSHAELPMEVTPDNTETSTHPSTTPSFHQLNKVVTGVTTENELQETENLLDSYMVFKLENRDDIDIKLIYTPILFHHLGLTAFISLNKTSEQNSVNITGGYFQPIEKLTIPFKFFVYLIEKNPLSLAIKNINFKSNSTAQTASDDKSKQNGDYSNTKIFSEDKKQEPSAQQSVENKPKIPQSYSKNIFDFSAITNLFASKTESPQHIEPVKEPSIEPVQELSNEPVQELSTVLEENYREKINIKIKRNDFIEDRLYIIDGLNGKTLREILNEYKNKPKTIEDFQYTGINYIILERIIVDIFSQLELLLNELNIIFTEINEDFIYNLNERHVLLNSSNLKYIGNDINIINTERTNNKKKLNELVRRITGNEKFENTKVYKLLK